MRNPETTADKLHELVNALHRGSPPGDRARHRRRGAELVGRSNVFIERNQTVGAAAQMANDRLDNTIDFFRQCWIELYGFTDRKQAPLR